MPEISIMPHRIDFFGMELGVSVVMGWLVTILLLIACVIVNRKIKKFKDKPTGLQNIVELIVEGVYNFSKGKVGHNADFCAPVVLTLMTFIAAATLVELLGLPPATEDLSCTLGLGLISFSLMNVTALKEFGLRVRIKRMGLAHLHRHAHSRADRLRRAHFHGAAPFRQRPGGQHHHEAGLRRHSGGASGGAFRIL